MLLEAAKAAEEAWTEASFRIAEAVGVSVDDVTDHHVAVAVHGGQIVYMGISDPLLALPADELADIVNGHIAIAFGSWREQLRSA
ncbi:hypothetical protein H7J07_05610 [Mycobacterium koreense]|uniref:Uncharacterized protein n=1 Tax=Mycolicibacillus koreensis TaxID=1069220 RepID=A0AA91PFY2_9MYCO|nr:hypothetical protein [Mycolicibacillus koreensis]MCV7247701.1 hypothetical protein [Mycolicibacillus koreensis]OSC34800.1 hypothetical protein B8W67_05820 [Mycolicibacillus koreensis]